MTEPTAPPTASTAASDSISNDPQHFPRFENIPHFRSWIFSPLHLKANPIVMASDPSTSNAPPSDAARIQALLKSMGVQDYEPGVVECLHDFAFKYVSEILLDAEAYGEHAGKASGVVEMDDVLLAIQVRQHSTETERMVPCDTPHGMVRCAV